MKRIALDVNDLVHRYLAGEPEQALSLRYGVDRGTIRKRLVENGITRRGISEANRLRMQRLAPEERRALAMAAHDAVRGKPRSETELIHRALARSRQIGAGEHLLIAWLLNRGYVASAQEPVGPYNIDVALLPVAVEIHLEPHHPSSIPKVVRRAHYLRDRGWHVCYVWITQSHFLTESAADEIVAFVQEARRNPTAPREYRVIRGDGQVAAPHRPHGQKRAAVVPHET